MGGMLLLNLISRSMYVGVRGGDEITFYKLQQQHHYSHHGQDKIYLPVDFTPFLHLHMP